MVPLLIIDLLTSFLFFKVETRIGTTSTTLVDPRLGITAVVDAIVVVVGVAAVVEKPFI